MPGVVVCNCHAATLALAPPLAQSPPPSSPLPVMLRAQRSLFVDQFESEGGGSVVKRRVDQFSFAFLLYGLLFGNWIWCSHPLPRPRNPARLSPRASVASLSTILASWWKGVASLHRPPLETAVPVSRGRLPPLAPRRYPYPLQISCRTGPCYGCRVGQGKFSKACGADPAWLIAPSCMEEWAAACCLVVVGCFPVSERVNQWTCLRACALVASLAHAVSLTPPPEHTHTLVPPGPWYPPSSCPRGVADACHQWRTPV